MSLHAPELDMRPAVAKHGQYKWVKTYALGGNASEVDLSASSLVRRTFEISTECMNLSKDILDFNLVLPSPGASGSFNYVFDTAVPSINRLTLATRAGMEIVKGDHMNIVQRVFAPYMTKNSDLMSNDIPNLAATTEATRVTTKNSMVARSDTLKTTAAVAGASNSQWLVNGAAANPAVSYSGIQEYVVGTDNGASYYHVSIPLSEFKGTFFSEVNDSVFPETLLLHIDFEMIGKIGFVETNVVAGAGTKSAFASARIENLFLYHCLEVDEEVCAGLKAKMNSGFSRIIPWYWAERESISSKTSFNKVVRLNPEEHGSKVLRIWNVNYHQTETGATSWDIDNGQEADGDCRKLLSRYSTLRGHRTTDFDVSSGQNPLDYMLMKKLISGSSVQNRADYNHNSVFVEDFASQRLCDAAETDSVDNGLDVSGRDIQYAFVQTHNGSISATNYVIVQGQKVLSIQNNQIMVV